MSSPQVGNPRVGIFTSCPVTVHSVTVVGQYLTKYSSLTLVQYGVGKLLAVDYGGVVCYEIEICIFMCDYVKANEYNTGYQDFTKGLWRHLPTLTQTLNANPKS